MQKNILPAAGIVMVTIILVALNELTELTFIKDYALVFIIAGMLFGVWLAKLSDRTDSEK